MQMASDDSALLVIDLQNDFMPGGALAVADGDAVVPIVNQLTRRFPNVVLTQDWHPAGHASFASSHAGANAFETISLDYGEQALWPDHCVQGSRGAELHQDLAIDRAMLILRKGWNRSVDSYSAFFEADPSRPTGLTGYFREKAIRRLYLCGLATDFCVAWSALDARRMGFETFVVEDACRAIDLNNSLAAAWMRMDDSDVRRIKAAELLEA
jgi:nicotinamidase/pyrazinamidase